MTKWKESGKIKGNEYIVKRIVTSEILKDIAVKIVCPVVSKHVSRNEIIIHGGAVHFSKDTILNTDGKLLFGRVLITRDGQKELLDTNNYLSKLSQEHGTIKVTPANFKSINVGDLVEIRHGITRLPDSDGLLDRRQSSGVHR